MNIETLKKNLENINSNDFTIIIEKDIIELFFYVDKRDNAICVTNKSYHGFSPCDCYENNKDGKDAIINFVKRVYPEIITIKG